MATAFTRETKKLIDSVLAAGKKATGKKPSATLQAYIKQLYLQSSMHFLSRVEPETLYHAAAQHLTFVESRKPSDGWKVRVYNPSAKTHGWTSERTIIEINLPDRPFLLDSVTNEILRQGFTIYETVHPVVRMTRKKNGAVDKIYAADDHDRPAESCMHIQLSYISGKAEREELRRGIERVFNYVAYAVRDWQAMLGTCKTIMADVAHSKLPLKQGELDESLAFLQWVLDNNFIFLGYREYRFSRQGDTIQPQPNHDSELGIFNIKEDNQPQVGLSALPASVLNDTASSLIDITKSTRRSLVHRPAPMDYIGIKIFDKKGRVVGEHRFLGLFTSSVYYQSAHSIPIIRQKIDYVMAGSDFSPGGHNSKALMTILETYPRDELLQVGAQALLDTCMGIVELTERPSTHLFVRNDRYNRFVSCLVYVPRDRFNTVLRRRVQALLEEAYGGTTSDFYIQLNEFQLARLHLLIQLGPESAPPNFAEIERKVQDACNSWYDGLRARLIHECGEREGEALYRSYENAFPESYKQIYHFGGTFHDIQKSEQAFASGELTSELYQLETDDAYTYQIKLFSPNQLVILSDILPMLENMGFDVVDQHTYSVKPDHQSDTVWVLHFRLRTSRDMKIPASKGQSPIADIKEEFEEAIYKIWHHEIENDALNKLILRAKLPWRDVMVLRAYLNYTVQTAFPYSRDYMASAVARYPQIATDLVQLFHARFAPDFAARDKAIDTLYAGLNRQLAAVESVVDDRVLRQFLETIQATLRTNAFQLDKQGQYRAYISFKLDSQRVPNLPKPRLFREIFVYSYDMEGIHLRGGKVARGGLRWSDRPEDFRTEVLGLVKAQMVKNSVIVPVGSKGGFVVKEPMREGESRDEWQHRGIACYKTFLSGLLDITDNYVKGKVVPPKQVVRHDEDDPYLVVAADKGTATFSDIANGLSEEYGFWLKDAFASGGSAGYDHKKMGITARGAWVSVKRHFAEMGIDTQSEPFTVAGIGGMAGDVFGNGMLLSKHIKLVAAFNHLHIFLDPDPDPAKSYKERQRLFARARGSWDGYDAALISKGGGVFERAAKTIKLTPEIRKLLDVDAKELAPDALIQAILRAPIDLIWNGGIGTYIKAEHETHEQVGDKANDATRVNGAEVRAKVIGEGGNLGLTQKGRIEYALAGGRVNTDAIDNSAGVDCSDHEVNIKIALEAAIAEKKLQRGRRDKFLESMTDEVAQLCLRDNLLQTQALTIAQLQGHRLLEAGSRVMRALEAKGLLDRAVEDLPTDEVLDARAAAKQGLTRPELSVILSYAKIDLYNDLIGTNVPDDEYFQHDVVHYFPSAMQEKYAKQLRGHALRREIITTMVANSIVNRMGANFFIRMQEDTGKKGCDIARAYVIARDAFGLRELWDEIEGLGTAVPVDVQVTLHLEIRDFAERCVDWFLRHHEDPLDAEALVALYQPNVATLSRYFDDIMSDGVCETVDVKRRAYMAAGVPEGLACKVSMLEAFASACDIIAVAQNTPLSMKEVGQLYYQIGSHLGLGVLRIHARKLLTGSYWDNLAVQSLIAALYDHQMRLTRHIVGRAKKGQKGATLLAAWEEGQAKHLASYSEFKDDLLRQETLSASMLTVASQRIEALLT